MQYISGMTQFYSRWRMISGAWYVSSNLSSCKHVYNAWNSSSTNRLVWKVLKNSFAIRYGSSRLTSSPAIVGSGTDMLSLKLLDCRLVLLAELLFAFKERFLEVVLGLTLPRTPWTESVCFVDCLSDSCLIAFTVCYYLCTANQTNGAITSLMPCL